jgi:hypothetical protein
LRDRSHPHGVELITARPTPRRTVDPVDPQAATNHAAATIATMRHINAHVTTDHLTCETELADVSEHPPRRSSAPN